MKHLLPFFFFSSFFLAANGQNPADEILRTKNWCFGFDTGLNTVDAPRLEFTPSGPTVFTDSHNLGAEGYSSTSTSLGALLAYGGHGIGAWYDGQNDTISGTENFVGGADRIQGSLVLPVSNGTLDQYFLFRMKSDGPVVEIDLEYDFIEVGQGSTGLFVAQGNNDIPLITHVTEAMCSVHKCNGQGYWMLAHKYESNEFLLYSVDSTGVVSYSIVPFGETVNQVQCVAKFSNNGSKVAFAAGRITVNGTLAPRLYLFEFDKMGGYLLNPLEIECPSHVNGLSFSPNNELLYLSTGTGKLVQYDLAIWDSLAVDSSIMYIWEDPVQMPFYLQLAMDGKIYGAQGGAPQNIYVARIENPDVRGQGCNYVHNAIYLSGSASGSGLPNFPESYFNTEPFAYSCLRNGMEDSNSKSLVKAFPIPATDMVTVEAIDPIVRLRLTNQLGEWSWSICPLDLNRSSISA
ncbi:MAG: hypothetical protein RL266_755 [Bacteroidota bacterium]